MSRIITLQDLPSETMIYKKDHDKKIAEYQKLALDLATRLSDAKKRKIQDNHYIMMLENKLKELKVKLGGTLKIEKPTIEQDNVFKRLNKLLIDEYEVKPEELERMKEENLQRIKKV